MNVIDNLKEKISSTIAAHLGLEEAPDFAITLSLEKGGQFGDITTNAAMVLAKPLKQNPRQLASTIAKTLGESLASTVSQVTVAGPGFINLTLSPATWQGIAGQLHEDMKAFFTPAITKPRAKYLIEFVSANPTGPLHLGHGRGAIIGDVLARVLTFLGHTVEKEFYINDAGAQIEKLGISLRARVAQACGEQVDMPEDGYHGDYLIALANECIATHGTKVLENDASFFASYAKEKLLAHQQEILKNYGVAFDTWFSEKTLHDDGSVAEAIALLVAKKLAYESEGALWFASTTFGDDKDRVIRKADGTLTYIAADIAYHKHKFDRGFAYLVDILGQDHHGYVKRLQATMEAIGYPAEQLHVILYQLVNIKIGEQAVKMSKRAGTFTTLEEIIETVGRDVARFFYLNRKADTHLEFDLETALKKTEENPVYYIQYAFVRTNSLLTRASQADEQLASFVDEIERAPVEVLDGLTVDEIDLLKKIISLQDILFAIEQSHQTHLLAYYTWELAQTLHNFYAKERVIDVSNIGQTKRRLLLVHLLRNALKRCLKLLGISTPEKM